MDVPVLYLGHSLQSANLQVRGKVPSTKSHSPLEPWIPPTCCTPNCYSTRWNAAAPSPGGKAALQGKEEVMMPAWWFLHCPVRLWWLLCCHYKVLLLYYKWSMNVCPSFQADSSFVSKVSLKFHCTIWYSWSCIKLEVGPGDSRDPFQSKLITDFMQHMDMIDTKSCLCLILCHICKSVWKGCISPKLIIYLFL